MENPMTTQRLRFTLNLAAATSAIALLAIAAAPAPAVAQTKAAAPSQEMVPALVAELARYKAAEKRVKKDIATFDTLDFDVYTNQKWDRLHESHSADILVHYPDGHTSKGLAAHIEELKPQFVFAPDARVTSHPIKFGQGEWTAVIGVIEGTFTQPMPIGDGKTIPPTGKTYKLTMTTVGHWKKGVMDEEFLFWDNAAFMKQIGIGQ
jgi:SnoaL-like polyketide cyclase